jgi:hypothetical protein
LKDYAAFYRDHLPFKMGCAPNLQSGAVKYLLYRKARGFKAPEEFRKGD